MVGISGALAMVTCGIILGNITRITASERTGMSATSYLKNFWHAVDYFLNALLFLLIGLLLVTLELHIEEVLLGLLMVPAVLLARFVSVSLPYLVFRRFRQYDRFAISILTWGGLRGGLALAMAASIPTGAAAINGADLHTLMVVITYVVVIFSIIVQGLTISPLIKRSIAASKTKS